MCMAEKHGEPLYYRTELDELRHLAKAGEGLKELCQRIRDRHEEDWSSDPTGERCFSLFLAGLSDRDVEGLWEQFLCVYQYVNALEEAITRMGLTIRTIRSHA